MALFFKTKREPLEYAKSWWLRIYVGFIFLMLYAPIATLIIFSFNDSKRNIVWRGFYYQILLESLEQ